MTIKDTAAANTTQHKCNAACEGTWPLSPGVPDTTICAGPAIADGDSDIAWSWPIATWCMAISPAATATRSAQRAHLPAPRRIMSPPYPSTE